MFPLADDEGTVALRAGASSIAGLGLFAVGPGKPAAIEYLMDGAPITDDEEHVIWENKLPGHEYMMSVAAVDDNGFRDETGRLRPKADAAAYVGRTLQELVWDSTTHEWQIVPPVNYVGLLNPSTNPAAYANDALYQVVDGVAQVEEYTKQDAELNALVMVPGLRRRGNLAAGQTIDKENAEVTQKMNAEQNCIEFEFCSMWFYPRRGWLWTNTVDATSGAATEEEDTVFGPELTVGYYWPLVKQQPDAYAQFCSLS